MLDEKIIKLRARQLCRENRANQYTARQRNRKIVSILMKEFKISEEYATECFLHNNEI